MWVLNWVASRVFGLVALKAASWVCSKAAHSVGVMDVTRAAERDVTWVFRLAGKSVVDWVVRKVDLWANCLAALRAVSRAGQMVGCLEFPEVASTVGSTVVAMAGERVAMKAAHWA